MEFRILGSLEVVEGTRVMTPSAPKLREVLALLVLRYNHPVQVSELIDELWGCEPPVSALSTLQTYIYKLRKLFGDGGTGESEHLSTKPYGYVLKIPDDNIDVARFESLAETGENVLLGGNLAQGSAFLSQALAVWRGPALADIAPGELIQAQITRLEERRLRVLAARIDVDLRLGRHRTLISELKGLVAQHPLNEGFHGNLMLALYRSGRRYDALELYRQFRELLVAEMGLEPTLALSQLHQAMLGSDASLDLPDAALESGLSLDLPDAAVRAPQAELVNPVRTQAKSLAPAQLPPDITDFSGRSRIVEHLEQWLLPGEDSGTGMRMIAISGMPGIGKTTLAIHVAHRVSHAFPGGQLYANLSGAGPVDTQLILKEFLRAVGVSPADIPVDTDEYSKLFRSWCATRDALIVLDGALHAAQVQPLLPGSSRCSVIVTGWVKGLPGALIQPLDTMSVTEGVEFLSKLLGPARVAAERQAAEKIVELCSHMPLAIRAAGTRLAMAPSLPLSRLARQLDESQNRLDDLCVGSLDVRTSFESTYRSFSRLEKYWLRMLSLLPAGVFGSAQAAAILGQDDLRVTEKLLSRLAENHLLRLVSRGPGDPIRYDLPELTKLFAIERLVRERNERGKGSASDLAS